MYVMLFKILWSNYEHVLCTGFVNILPLYEQRETEILLHCLLIYYSEHDWPLNQAVSECDQTLSEYFYFCHGYSANEKSNYGH